MQTGQSYSKRRALDWGSYHNRPAVGQICLYAEDVVVSDLDAAALWVI